LDEKTEYQYSSIYSEMNRLLSNIINLEKKLPEYACKTKQDLISIRKYKKERMGLHRDYSNSSGFYLNAYNVITVFKELHRQLSKQRDKWNLYIKFMESLDPVGCLDYQINSLSNFIYGGEEDILDFHQPFLTNFIVVIQRYMKENPKEKYKLDEFINGLNQSEIFQNFLFNIITYGLKYGGVQWIEDKIPLLNQSSIYTKYYKQLKEHIPNMSKYPFLNWEFILKSEYKGNQMNRARRIIAYSGQKKGGYVYNVEKGRQFVHDLIHFCIRSYVLNTEVSGQTQYILNDYE
jgi:hypothetical protein